MMIAPMFGDVVPGTIAWGKRPAHCGVAKPDLRRHPVKMTTITASATALVFGVIRLPGRRFGRGFSVGLDMTLLMAVANGRRAGR